MIDCLLCLFAREDGRPFLVQLEYYMDDTIEGKPFTVGPLGYVRSELGLTSVASIRALTNKMDCEMQLNNMRSLGYANNKANPDGGPMKCTADTAEACQELLIYYLRFQFQQRRRVYNRHRTVGKLDEDTAKYDYESNDKDVPSRPSSRTRHCSPSVFICSKRRLAAREAEAIHDQTFSHHNHNAVADDDIFSSAVFVGTLIGQKTIECIIKQKIPTFKYSVYL